MDRSLVQSRKNVVYQHYGRSVALLARELGERQPGAEENALVNCVIYIIVDFLWGNLATSIVHLQAGSNILKQWKKRRPKGRPIAEGSLEACLIAVYDTMGHQHQVTNIAARPATPLNDDVKPPANEFENLAAAKRSIEQISTDGMRLARNGSALSETPADTQEKSKFEAVEDAHNSMLQLWKYKFETLLSSLGSGLARNESESVNSMRLLYLSSVIWLWDVPQGANRKEEPLRTFDEFIDVAEWLAATAQEEEAEGEGERFLVSFYDSRVWPSIAIIATNCSSPDLKKRALGILAKAIPSPKPNPESDSPSGPVDDNWQSWAEMSK
ncbi:hypothetical protein BJ875DRAFT_506727 [Amylocarpus encephaloides]|uniref:Uncharacterized protein n=1 Tax=Amylocarpus encephaloides TaxID=45428 RepID=A0A9P7YCU7_9HELO|nr:hypothetical protein BJ875DRAFT_506727 [Amylocarpus encephaloides]